MINFQLYIPTKMFFGEGVHTEVGEVVRGYGFDNILLLYGGESIKRTGLYDTVTEALRASGVRYIEMGGVQPNPTVEFCREVAALVRESGVQMILAVGGGSVIDTAKMAAHAVANNADVLDIQLKRVPIEKTLPVGVVLTISAAGSETSDSAVLTDMATGLKKGLSTDFNRPLFAIMDPTLTYTVSPYQTACGVTDILMHTMERYMRLDAGDHELVDRVSEALLTSVIEAGRAALRDPRDYDARATLMLAGSWAHNGLTGAGAKTNMSAHKLEHEMSGLDCRIAHGAGLAVVWPAYLTYIYKADPARVARYAAKVWGVEDGEPEAMALEGIRRTRAYFREIGMPSTLGELGLGEEDIEIMADKATAGGKNVIDALKPLAKADIIEIYKLCL